MKSWLFMGTLFLLCGVLGVLQYQWIGEFSMAAGDRLRAALEVNLTRVSQDFNSEIGNAFREIAPMGAENAEEARAALERKFEATRKNGQGARVFRRIGLVTPKNGQAALEILDKTTGKLQPAEWPETWSGMRERLSSRVGPPFPPMEGGGRPELEGLLMETPLFLPGPPPEGRKGRGPGFGFPRKEVGWVVYELDPDYLRESVLPEVVERHVETAEYDVEVIRRNPPGTIWTSSAKAKGIAATADASIGLLDARMAPWGDGGRGRGGKGGRPPGRGPGGPGGPGRWTVFVRHQAGSLDAVVAQTRWKNLAVTGGVLLLLVATIVALFRFTRNAQRLAHLQMDFVAGVSHELRTPLTAIYTAA